MEVQIVAGILRISTDLRSASESIHLNYHAVLRSRMSSNLAIGNHYF
jgi:hypothetical protein